MKLITVVLCIIFISLFRYDLYSQTDCTVLKQGIEVSYTGQCKKGLADGEGIAIGVDHYKGSFKKGLPDGKGTYTWLTGETYAGEWKKGLRDGNGQYSWKYMGRDTAISGLWRDDKFIGEKDIAPYVIEYRNNIGRVSIVKIDDRPNISYKFSRNGGVVDNISGLFLQGSSGNESQGVTFTGFERVSFPFSGKIEFEAPNSFNSVSMACEVRFTINQPGYWVVTVFY
jgi:hypothetical protein